MRALVSLAGVLLLATLAGCSSSADCCGVGAPARGVVRHVVLFKFKDSASSEQVRGIEEKFRGLKARIPEIIDFEWGTNVSPENHAQGFTHCFVLTFRDPAARDAYLPHPAHKEFGAQLGPFLDKVLVVDYISRG
jgi:hypothetical protein